jgi:site-specific DNA-methyltransferase (cytosine-N4-specific)
MSHRVDGVGQMDLFGAVLASYLDGQPRSNDALYRDLADSGRLSATELDTKVPVGAAGVPFSLTKRRIRWYQQTLKEKGVLERVPGERGTWRIAERDKKGLTKAPPKVVMLGFSTDLGVALWGSCHDVFGSLTESIAVCVTSPPYALAKPRAYGNPNQSEWVDFVCRALEPIVKRLVPGGSIAINVSNDVFEPGLPSRSLVNERLTIAMADRFSMHLMDRLVWENKSKPPGPYQWASKKRMQLNTGYEPVLVFCNDPLNMRPRIPLPRRAGSPQGCPKA